MSRLLSLLVVATLVAPAAAQTVRFETSVGAFDMLLNPTNNADLQSHVDNLLANVAAGVYHRAVVNRAAEDFVLQIGSFQTESVEVAEIPEFGFAATNAFEPVVVDADNDGNVDFSTAGLTNSRGTVSLALSAGNANSGSASFFVNVGDNAFLDNQDFIPFAQIADMATVDRIMNQRIVDLSADVGQNGSLAYTDVPLADDGDLIVIESAAVISGDNQVFVGPLRNAFGFDDQSVVTSVIEETPPSTNPALPTPEAIEDFVNANGRPPTDDELTNLLLAAGSVDDAGSSFVASSAASSAAIPEPSSLLLAAFGLLAARRRA